ncbi:MAG: CoA transferase [Actinomycetia bacterium]|nr:CoA transferase [Actinomycetes bacterium]
MTASTGTGQAPASGPRHGPLHGVRVVEVAGIGPGPFAAMLLADLGADVVRVDRPAPSSAAAVARADVVNRGKRSLAVDLKAPAGLAVVQRLVTGADVLVEGFRPGVMERLGLGPDVCLAANPRLVYARMTGWGQEGPLAATAGHDIDYIALTGALWATGRSDERPVPALNLVGDYGGGSMFLVLGILAALVERSTSARGQVVDAAMVDGVAVLTTMFTALRRMGVWRDQRGANLFDTGAPFYEVYECADGRYLAVGALEHQFYVELVNRTGFRAGQDDAVRLAQGAPDDWPAAKEEWAALFRTRTRDEWAALLGETDACAQPVLDWTEALEHPHLRARGTYTTVDGVQQPAPAPRFDRTSTAVRHGPPAPGEHTLEVLAELGFPTDEAERLLADGAVSQAPPP